MVKAQLAAVNAFTGIHAFTHDKRIMLLKVIGLFAEVVDMVTTGVGKDIMPESDVQCLFNTCAIIVGVIVCSVGTALQSIDKPDSQRRRRMDSLREIHSALKEKLDLEVNQQLFTKVPHFKQLPDELLLVLHSLVSRIYLNAGTALLTVEFMMIAIFEILQ